MLRSRIPTILSLLAALILGQIESSRAGSSPDPVKQPPLGGQVLVVTANLEEAWDAADNADAADLSEFVDRVTHLTPHAPDVLLLQEVTRASTERVVRLLEAQTGRRYAVAASAGKSPIEVKKDRVLTKETSIVVNAGTMQRIGRPRYLSTTFRKRHGAKGQLREVKMNAAVLLRERRTGMTIPVANVHFHTSSAFRSKRLSKRYRSIWSQLVARKLRAAWPRYASQRVIGGDFNAARVREVRGRYVTERWWRRLTSNGFRDAIVDIDRHGGVDYIFTRTGVAAAGVDSDYPGKAAEGTPAYYSDHKLRWALLGKWRARLDRAEAVSSMGIEMSWTPLPGVREYRIQRSNPGSRRWRTEAVLPRYRSTFRDRYLRPSTPYRYRLIAWNGAEASRPSPVVRVRTRKDITPPRRPDPPRLTLHTKPLALKLTWKAVKDRGGSEVAGYVVWKDRPNGDPQWLIRTRRTTYIDRRFVERPGTEYSVVAFDTAGNRTGKSRYVTVPSIKTR